MNKLTEDILKGAEVNKSQQKKKRTTAQLPIYRDASNLLYIIMRVMYHAPRKMTKALDEAIVCGTELCRSLALANEVRGMERAAALNIALANAYTLSTIIGSLAYLDVISKPVSKDLRKKINTIVAQGIGWRESATQQGQNVLPKGGAR